MGEMRIGVWMTLLEICLESVDSAVIAEQNGAHRVELCSDLIEGGLTPSYGTIKACRKLLTIPIMVMIRPRGGDFCYTETEFEIMKHDVDMAKSLGVHGVVLGLLTSDGRVDMERTRELAQLAAPLEVTFHRAFDMTRDPFEALEDLIQIQGIHRILTSGQDSGVLEGLDLIKELTRKANNRIIILPGCGITKRNLPRILGELEPKEVHMALQEDVESLMRYRNGNVFMGVAITTPEYSIKRTSGKGVKEIASLLK